MVDVITIYKEIVSRGQYQFTYVEGNLKHGVVLGISVPDILEYSDRKFIRFCHPSIKDVITSMIPQDKKLKAIISRSPLQQYRFLENDKKAGEKTSDKVICEEWNDGFEILRSEIPDVKDVYMNHNVVGSPQFDSVGNVYMLCEAAEKTFTRGYFGDSKDPISINPKFRLTSDFGETMIKTRETKLVMRDAVTKQFKYVDLGVDSLSPIFVRPLDSPSGTLLITALVRPNSLYTPGLSRCFNRETKLFARADSELTCLSDGLYTVLAPIVSPDGSTIAIIGADKSFDTHCTELDLFMMKVSPDFSTPEKVTIPKGRDDTSPTPTFNGVYLSAQGESELMSFLPDNETLVLPSFANGRSGIFLINTRTVNTPVSVFPPIHASKLSSVVLLKVVGNEIVFAHSGYTEQRSIWVAKVHSRSEIEYIDLFGCPRLDEKICAGFHDAKISVIQGSHCPAWLLESGSPKTGPRPLIAYLHGGPFMGAISGFSVEMTAFLSQGYDIVIPNYRGSFSFGREFLHELEGFVGIKDVEDCQNCIELAKDMLNPSVIVAYGGSHGGFLTGWLLGHPKYQPTYAGGVLWNPAVDLVSSNLTSDIPDWAVNVTMGKINDPMEKFAPSIDFVSNAYKQSAISVVKNVKAPSLVLLGSNDKRVVPCAGLRWAQAVKENGGDVDVHWYPDQGHAIAGPEFYETAIVTIGLWIKQKFTS